MRAGVVSSRCPEPCPVSATVKVAEKGVCAKMLATCRMRALSSCLPVGLRPTARSPALRSKLNHGSNLQNYELMEALSKAPLTVYSGQIVGKGTMVPRAGKLGSTPEVEDTVELEIKVGGMMCEGCTSRVTEVLKSAPNVTRVEVSLEKALASVEVKAPSQLDALGQLNQLVDAVKAIGFEAEPHISGL